MFSFPTARLTINTFHLGLHKLPMKAAGNSVILVLILSIAPILFTTIVADEDLETLPARFDRNARRSLSSDPERSSEVQISNPVDIRRGKDQDHVQTLLRRQRRFDHGSQSISQSLSERVQIPAVGQLIWDRFHVVLNNSALASYATTKLYLDITKLPPREQWLGPAVHIFILSCGAIKLTFEIVTAERRVSWQTAWAFVLDFVNMMIHISRSVALASYRVLVITAFVTYFVTLYIVEHPSQQRHLITGPGV